MTKVFGLIGYPLKNSFSKAYFEEKYLPTHPECSYENFEIPDISQIRELVASIPNFAGFNVTKPFKQSIIPFLDKLDETALEVGAVNCVKIHKDEKGSFLTGYNTDIYGFDISVLHFTKPAIKPFKVMVLGSGGASKAVCFVLNKLQIEYLLVARKQTIASSITYADLTPEIVAEHKLLVNCTSVGMSPNEEELLPIPYEGIGEDHYCYDLIYKPALPTFLKACSHRGAYTKNGLEMLHLQADKSYEIWNQKE